MVLWGQKRPQDLLLRLNGEKIKSFGSFNSSESVMCESRLNLDHPDSELFRLDSDSELEPRIRIRIKKMGIDSDSAGFGFKVPGFVFVFEMPRFTHY